MRIRRREGTWLRWAAPLIALTLTACSSDVGSEAQSDNNKPVVIAVNYPLKYFAERIGGDLVDVQFPVPRDVDPAFWNPGADRIEAIQRADVILLNGANYAKWRDNVSLSESKTVDTSRGFQDRFIQIATTVTHRHGPEGDHSHTGTAFTTWLDFGQAAEQAAAVHETLARLLPEHAETFESNFTALKSDLLELDRAAGEIAEQIGDQPLVASHPVYQYFARRYELNLRSVLWEPGTVPDADAIAQLQSLLEQHPARWMIWEAEPARESVKQLEALGVRSVVFDPCGNSPAAGDFLSIMRMNLDTLKQMHSP